MKAKHALWIMIISVLILIGLGFTSMAKQNNKIKDGCQPTDLVVVGNKGHAERVYDCRGVDIGKI